jgi:hypothetical protein
VVCLFIHLNQERNADDRANQTIDRTMTLQTHLMSGIPKLMKMGMSEEEEPETSMPSIKKPEWVEEELARPL